MMELEHVKYNVLLELMQIRILCTVKVDVQDHTLLIQESISVFKYATLRIYMQIWIVEISAFPNVIKLAQHLFVIIQPKLVFLNALTILTLTLTLLSKPVFITVQSHCIKTICRILQIKDVLINV